MREKIVLIGAGSALFTRGLVYDLIRYGQDVDLILVDIDETALAVAESVARKMIKAKRASINVQTSVDRRAVLANATVVICTIAVGGRRSRELDVFIPRKYGIYQTVGDSVGPGGTIRALRMIPTMVEIAKDVLDLAPNALFFNYANPMSAICRAVRKATGANIIGLCHGVKETARYLAESLNATLSELSYSAVGINHLTWFTEVSLRGQNAISQLKKMAQVKIAEWSQQSKPVFSAVVGNSYSKTTNKDAPSSFPHYDDAKSGGNRLCWHLLNTFGAFPSALDRHVSEFFPQLLGKNQYYGKTLGLDAFSFEEAIAFGDKRHEEMNELAFSNKPLDNGFFKTIDGEHEEVVDIIQSIRENEGKFIHTNLPNYGQTPDLPQEAIIESPAIATANGIKALSSFSLSRGQVGLLAPRLAWVETVVEAALEGSREKLIQSLILDGATCSFETAVHLADEYLLAHAEFLPKFA